MADVGTVGFILDNLKETVIKNLELFSTHEDFNSKSLCDNLDWLSSYVKRSGEDTEYENDDNILKLVYRTEDAIEKFISRRRNKSAVERMINAFDQLYEFKNIGKDLRNNMRDVQSLIDKVKLGGAQIVTADINPRIKLQKEPIIIDDTDMVGFEDVVQDITGSLSGGPVDLQVFSIVGCPGLGKTTVARNVFKHPAVEYLFFARAFISIPADYRKKELLLQLTRHFEINLTNEEIYSVSEERLEQVISEYLSKRQFLIVLDNISTPEEWDAIRGAFPSNQKRSRVLITTQNMDVARYVGKGQGREPYKLRFLSPGESSDLLRKKVFGEEEFPSHLEMPEMLILDRCDGHPLAIIIVAGILISNREESNWWKKVARKVETFSLAETGGVKNVIWLSFNNLPYHLKPCFLYLGIFPDGYVIPSKTLFQLWVSEGFVPLANGEMTSEDRAEDCLEELVNRSLVLVDKRRLNGHIKSIRLISMVREFCKVQGEKKKLFRAIEMSEPARDRAHYDDDFRILVNSNFSDYFKRNASGKYLRSFLTLSNDFLLPLEQTPHSHILEALNCVRVLDIRSIKLKHFPAEINDNLLLLKYLAMFSELKVIPRKMSNLTFLQTLIFLTTQCEVEIKADIWKMARLRHLVTNVPANLTRNTENLPVNENLQTLTIISVESCTKEVFDRANKLKKLAICGTLANFLDECAEGSLFHCLQQLEFLENLKLLNNNGAAEVHRLPSSDRFPANLTRLTLKKTMLPWLQMSILGKLRKLEVLKLKDNAFVGALWETESDGFPSLKVLHIGTSTDLVTWKASESHFPRLTKLHLMHCPKLEAIPRGLINRSNLGFIQIHYCNAALASSARKLVLAKLQLQAQDKNDKSTPLKLAIYPPEER